MKYIYLLFWATILCLSGCSEPPIKADILITGGMVYDGTDNPASLLDVAILGDKIIYVGPAGHVEGKKIIDGTGLIVAPGFIDPHTHSLDDLKSDQLKQNANYLSQGVTTVFNGNDGGGSSDIAATLDMLTAHGIGTNTALYVGQGAVRLAVMGMVDDTPTPDQMSKMKAPVKRAMEEGAFGLSSGLYYAPGSYSSTLEVAELATMIKPYDGIYESHIRDESTYNIGLKGAVQEVIDIGKFANVKVHVAHIKALGVDVWGQSKDVIKMIEAAQEEGVRITADQYPWLATGTGVRSSLLPRYVQVGGDAAMRARLMDAKILPTIKDEMGENMLKRGGAEALLLTGGDANITVGRTLAEEAAARKKEAIDTAIEIILEGDSNVANFSINEDDMRDFMQRPWVMTSSDGSYGHPRKYATFPTKYRRYVVEKKYITLQDFIHRSTGLTAKTVGLKDRGTLEKGKFADIVIFDEQEFAPKADFVNPRELSVGVKYLLVNGGLAIIEGNLTNELYGRALKKENN